MKSNADLLNLYKDEKAHVIGSLSDRTGLEDFPTYKEWKADYVKEYNETHDVANPLTMEEAVALTDAEVEAAGEAPEEDLLAQLVAIGESTEEKEEGDAQAPTEATPKVATKPKPQPAKKAAAGKKTSKAARAQVVFDRMYPGVLAGTTTRKLVIDELVAEVELTANGAATYYQKMKKAAAAA